MTKGVSGQMCRALHQQRGRSVRDPTSSFARHSNMLLEQERNRNRLKALSCYRREIAACMLSTYTKISSLFPSQEILCLTYFFNISVTVRGLGTVVFPNGLENRLRADRTSGTQNRTATTGRPERSCHSTASNILPGCARTIIISLA